MAQVFVPQSNLQLQDQYAQNFQSDTSIPYKVDPSKALDPMVEVATAYAKYDETMQEISSDAEAQDAINKFNEYKSKRLSDLQNAQGQNALENYKTLDSDLETKAKSFGVNLEGKAKNKYDKSIGTALADGRASGYAIHGNQAVVANNKAMLANIDNLGQSAMDAFGSDQYNARLQEMFSAINNMGAKNGWTKEEIDAVVLDKTTKVWETGIRALITQDNFSEAAYQLNQGKGVMDEYTHTTLTATLNAQRLKRAKEDEARRQSEANQKVNKLLQVGKTYEEAEDYDTAQAYYTKAYEYNPELALAYMYFANHKRAKDYHATAKQSYEIGDKKLGDKYATKALKEYGGYFSQEQTDDLVQQLSIADSKGIEDLWRDIKDSDTGKALSILDSAVSTGRLTPNMEAQFTSIIKGEFDKQIEASWDAALATKQPALIANNLFIQDVNGNRVLTEFGEAYRSRQPERFADYVAKWDAMNTEIHESRVARVLKNKGLGDYEKLVAQDNMLKSILDGEGGAVATYKRINGIKDNKRDAELREFFKKAWLPKVQKQVDDLSAQTYRAYSYEAQKDYHNLNKAMGTYNNLYANNTTFRAKAQTTDNPFSLLPSDFQKSIRAAYTQDTDGETKFNEFVANFNAHLKQDTVGSQQTFNQIARQIDNGLMNTIDETTFKNMLLESNLSTAQRNTLFAQYEDQQFKAQGSYLKTTYSANRDILSNAIFNSNYKDCTPTERLAMGQVMTMLDQKVTEKLGAVSDPVLINKTRNEILDDPNFINDCAVAVKQSETYEDRVDDYDDTIANAQLRPSDYQSAGVERVDTLSDYLSQKAQRDNEWQKKNNVSGWARQNAAKTQRTGLEKLMGTGLDKEKK